MSRPIWWSGPCSQVGPVVLILIFDIHTQIFENATEGHIVSLPAQRLCTWSWQCHLQCIFMTTGQKVIVPWEQPVCRFQRVNVHQGVEFLLRSLTASNLNAKGPECLL